MDLTPFRRLIEIRAYEIWEYRMANNLTVVVDGNGEREITPDDDWLEAERQIEQEVKEKRGNVCLL